VHGATTLLTYAVLGFLAVRLVQGARFSRTAHGRRLVAQVWRNARWRHIWPAPLVLVVVGAMAVGLMAVPGLQWGWWSLLGGVGNPVFGESSATTGTVLEWLVPVAFVCLLVPALPLFAHAEERAFRQGAEGWSLPRRVGKVVTFGLAHALIGIPIGAALALSLGGAYFMVVYLRRFRRTGSQEAAVLESTTAHTVYNAVIIVLVVVVLLAATLS
jgi:hypothetical protein